MSLNSVKRGLLVFVLLSIILSTVAFAQETTSPIADPNEVFSEAHVAPVIEEPHYDAGITPDSAIYFIDIIFDQFASPEDLAAEKLAEMREMTEAHDYEAAGIAAEHYLDSIEIIETTIIETYSETYDEVDPLLAYEGHAISHDDYVEEIRDSLVYALESGQITQEDVEATHIDDIREETVEFVDAVGHEKEEFTHEVLSTQLDSHIEAELQMEAEEAEHGLHEEYREDVTLEEVAEAEAAIIAIEADLAQLTASQTPIVSETAIEGVLEAAEFNLEECKDALEDGDISDAFGHFTAAENLILNADHFVGASEDFLSHSPEEQAAIKAELEHEMSDIQAALQEEQRELAAEAEAFVSDYEAHKAELEAKYPNRASSFEDDYEEHKKVIELASELEGEFSAEFNRLTTEEGKSSEEATHILTERFYDRYREVYGEEPPEIMSDWVAEHNMGGFVEGQVYTDPVTGYTYTFSDDHYTVFTPEGTQEIPYPEDYHPATFPEGDETHTYTVDTPEGTATYEFTPTGYRVTVTNDDGTTTTRKIAYEGSHEVVGGGVIHIYPTGYEVKYEGQVTEWEYSPEYDTYISNEGESITQDISVHSEGWDYDDKEGNYGWDDGHEEWTFDPVKDEWTNIVTGEVHQPSGAFQTTQAPVGHEDDEAYTTEHGETWTYSNGVWTSSTGASYNEATREQTTASGTTYHYDKATDTIVSADGTKYIHDESTGYYVSDSYYTSGSYGGNTDAEGHSYGGSSSDGSGGGDGSGGHDGGGDGGGGMGHSVFDVEAYLSKYRRIS